MKLGNRIYQILILFFFFLNLANSEEKITTTPLINLDKIKPSFEELNNESEKLSPSQNIKKKKKNGSYSNSSHAILILLYKITAKSLKIIVNINEVKKFDTLYITIITC